jgi:hypothetical protein
LIGALGLKTPLGDYKVDEGLHQLLQLETEATVLLDLLCSNGLWNFRFRTNGGNIASNDVPNSYTSELKLDTQLLNFMEMLT